ncbi:CYTH domain protein [compost metagenome]
MAKEIERKWLVNDLTVAIAHSTNATLIAQAYLNAGGCFVRVLTETMSIINIQGHYEELWLGVYIPTKDAEEILLHDNSTLTYRIRRSGKTDAFITIKGRSTDDGLSRDEWEYPISLELYRDLVSSLQLAELTKYRHFVPFGDLTIEVDEFRGHNTGLVVAEIEFPEGYDMPTTMDWPEWFGREVTGVVKYYNSMLLKWPFTTWAKD